MMRSVPCDGHRTRGEIQVEVLELNSEIEPLIINHSPMENGIAMVFKCIKEWMQRHVIGLAESHGAEAASHTLATHPSNAPFIGDLSSATCLLPHSSFFILHHRRPIPDDSG